MNNRNFLAQIFLFGGGGIAAGFVSLAASSVVGLALPLQEGYSAIFALVLVEESFKLGGLALLLASGDTWLFPGYWRLLPAPIFFGIGFGAFELLLIRLNFGSVPLNALAVGYVHLITSVFLFSAIYVIKIKKREMPGYLLILLAVLIHLCYNIFVAS